MNKITLLLAWRYVIGAKHEKNIASMVKVSFLSILIGAFSLALVTAIMNGFEKATHEKMQSIHAQIIIRADGRQLAYGEIAKILKAEFPAIQSFSPTSMRQLIVQANGSDDITNVILLKAIEPDSESKTTGFQKKIINSITPQKTLAATVNKNNILIGSKLAKNINAQSGDTINLVFTKEEEAVSQKIKLHKTNAVVGGIFSTGIDEFDTSMALSSFNLFNDLFPDAGITQINIQLKPGSDEDAIINSLRKRFALEVYSWKELYPALVSALKLEKYAMFLILALITLVASMNIISLLFMQITQKRPDIAILKAMGLSDGHISSIFIAVAMGITFAATTMGLLLACGASWILETYPFITLPDAYYISHLPAKMEWHLLGIVFIVIMIISFIATWFPAGRTRSINISNVLRFQS